MLPGNTPNDSICTESTELNPRGALCLVKSQTESKWQRQGSNESLSDSIPVLFPPSLPCSGMSQFGWDSTGLSGMRTRVPRELQGGSAGPAYKD